MIAVLNSEVDTDRGGVWGQEIDGWMYGCMDSLIDSCLLCSF
jgi:hypothetical protein